MNIFRDILDGAGDVIARKEEIGTLRRHLLKSIPDHVSVIGPKGYGKSPILRYAASSMQSEEIFDSVVYWDMRRESLLRNDEDFLNAFWERIRIVIRDSSPELIDECSDDRSQDMLRMLFSFMDTEGKRILVFLDGLDRILLSASTSRNLWDFLRSLAELTSLTLITASRSRLRELCANPDSRTSDFWNIFYETPLVIGAYGETDWNDITAQLARNGRILDDSTLNALKKWTGGIPRLVFSMCERLCSADNVGAIDVDLLSSIGEEVVDECRDTIADIWDGCPARQQTLLLTLEDMEEVSRNDVSGQDLKELVVKGLVFDSGECVTSTAKLVGTYGRIHGERILEINDLLGTPNRYRENIYSLLQLRLDSAEGIDPDIRRELELVLSVVKQHPARAADLLRNVAGVALDKIIEAELPPDGIIPGKWIEEWEGIRNFHFVPHQNPPRIRDQKRKTVRAMVDERTSCPSRIRFSTFLLLDHIYDVGNYGNHVDEMGGEEVPFMFVAPVCLMAIHLAEQLSEDLVL